MSHDLEPAAKGVQDPELPFPRLDAGSQVSDPCAGGLTVCWCAQVKPHLFAHTKHRIAQLSYLLGQREQQEA